MDGTVRSCLVSLTDSGMEHSFWPKSPTKLPRALAFWVFAECAKPIKPANIIITPEGVVKVLGAGRWPSAAGLPRATTRLPQRLQSRRIPRIESGRPFRKSALDSTVADLIHGRAFPRTHPEELESTDTHVVLIRRMPLGERRTSSCSTLCI